MRILLVLALTACSGSQGTKPLPVQRTTSDNTCENVAWSCVEMKPGTEDGARCVEGNAAQTSQDQCAEKHGRYTLGSCMRDNLVGGCTLARGDACATTWYYPPSTRESVEADCAKQGALYVAP